MIYRLPVSAFFSIAVHALIMLFMTGVVLFPTDLFKSLKKLDVTIIAHPETKQSQTDKYSGQRMEKNEKRIVTQGNAQWKVKPGIHDEAAWSGLQEQRLRHRTVSAAAPETRDAAYLAKWRERIESFGTSYYQQRIKQQPLSGEVRILVSIGPKGELLEAAVRQSSGEPSLDTLALEILKKAAPFEPLPEEIRKDTDVLEIMRTWKFTAGEGLRSG